MIDHAVLPDRPAPRTAGLRIGLFRTVTSDTVQIVVLPLVAAAAALAGWQFLIGFAGVPPSILPPPATVIEQLVSHYGLLLKHAIPTTIETLLAFGIAIPLGVALAVAMTSWRLVNRALYPNIIFFQLIPKIALAPLFIVWLGIGSPSRITFSVFISFFPILIATATGLRAVGPDMVRLCRSLDASELQILTHVRFPTALPHIFSGMKIAVTLAIIGIVVGEFIASQSGLGYLILFATSRQQTDLGLACIAVLCSIGLLLYGAVVLAERMMLRLYGDR